MNDDILNLISNYVLEYVIAILFLEIVLELLQTPHVSWNLVHIIHYLSVLCNTIV